jgi:hypothetical protein
MWRATESVDKTRAISIVALALILSVLAGAKLSFLPRTGPFGLDGSFYVNAARNVYEGAGLRTNISMYHLGHTELPTRSPVIYPLWPLVIGWTAHAIGFFAAVNYLPPLFFVLDLLLLYCLTRRMQVLLSDAPPGSIHAGHLVVLLFGLNLQFFGTTTYPYTEGLGFFLAFSALLLIDHAATTRPGLYGALAGVAAGLSLLTRTQLVILGLALLFTVVWAALSERRFAAAAAGYAAVYGAIAAYWYFFVFHVPESPRAGLPVWQMWSEPETTAAWFRSRWEGVTVSLSPFDRHSYFAAFGPVFLVPLVGGVVALARWLRSGDRAIRLRGRFLLPAAAVLYGLGTYASLNLFHLDPSAYGVRWLFWYRHGLPMIVAIACGAAYLWGRGRMARWGTIVLATASVVLGAVAVIGLITAPPAPAPTAAEAALSSWLDASRERPTIVTAKAQHLSVYTHANIHWTQCQTPAAKTRLMLEKLPIDYVVVYAAERDCSFVQGLGDVLTERAAFGNGHDRIHLLGRRAARK